MVSHPHTPKIPKFPALKTKALTWPKNSAGHHLTTKVPLATSQQTLSSIRSYLTDHIDQFDTINYVYIITGSHRLVGILSIRELLKHPPETKVSSIMTKSNLLTAKPDTSPNQLAHQAIKNSIKAVPVVDQHRTLIGVVPSDRIQTILQHETQQKLLNMAGVLPQDISHLSTLETPLLKSFISRLPWILVGLLGGLFVAQVINFFSPTLEQNLILAAFIPLVAYLANAVGTQTQTLFIRDLILNHQLNFTTYLLRQTLISTLIGLTCFASITLITTLFWSAPFLGTIIGISVFISILIASYSALIIPHLISRLNHDPALGSGPFATIIQDLLSVIVYFLIANLFLAK